MSYNISKISLSVRLQQHKRNEILYLRFIDFTLRNTHIIKPQLFFQIQTGEIVFLLKERVILT